MSGDGEATEREYFLFYTARSCESGGIQARQAGEDERGRIKFGRPV